MTSQLTGAVILFLLVLIFNIRSTKKNTRSLNAAHEVRRQSQVLLDRSDQLKIKKIHS